MLDRPTLSRSRKPGADIGPEPKATQTRAAEERFMLKVDGQAKCSLGDKAAALVRAKEIKKSFPVVVVTVVDTSEGTTEVVGPK